MPEIKKDVIIFDKKKIYMVVFNEEKQQQKLTELRKKEGEDLAELLSGKYGLPYIDLSNVSVSPDVLHILSEKDAMRGLLAAFRRKGDTLHLAVFSPNNDATKDVIAELKRKEFGVELYMTSMESLKRAWILYKNKNFTAEKAGIIEVSNEEIQRIQKEVVNVANLKELVEGLLAQKDIRSASRILEAVFGGSLAVHASDVHIEPEEGSVRLRLRLDGILQDLCFFEAEIYHLLLSRIKLVSGLKLNVRDKAQDGRFSFTVEGRDVAVRTSVIPGAYGESVVMRLLDPKSIGVPLEELGFNKQLYTVLERAIHRPNGLILNTGPTGSGKTTSLYACLNKIYNPEMKILTIENPIEYHLAGIVQTQVDKARGYTFLEGLRSALRQDPDVILVGEIRDIETASTAINSSLTGHLVLSTLHTNNAAGTIPRLVDMGVNPKIISSALSLSLAQRLIRKLCEHCKTEDSQTAEEKDLIDRLISGIAIDPPANHGKVWRNKGCEKCSNSGYKGRIPVIEGILMDRAIEEVIKDNPSEREITAAAKPQNLPNMAEDGVMKVLKGISTLTELGRVVDLTDLQ